MLTIGRDSQAQIEEYLFQGKVIILYGTRQVGKTTLCQQLLEKYSLLGKKGAYLNCELLTVKQRLETTNEQILRDFLGPFDLVVLDEAQSIENIGGILKILNDTFPEIQIIATGSSSFDLANKTGEPLVGRSKTFVLYPFSVHEISNVNNLFEIDGKLENILQFGMYPRVFGKSDNMKEDELESIVSGYLYKDVLAFENIKHSRHIVSLLQVLALQIGNEVSFNEVSNKLGISVNTVIKYIDLLEKCFILFTLPAFSRNIRNEVGFKSRKIYFYDIGIRNSLINNFSRMSLRNDVGAIWETFCVSELIKKAQREKRRPRHYFWRTYSKQEIDYIEEEGGVIRAYEFKYGTRAKAQLPGIFAETYGVQGITVINQENWPTILLS
jgi:predicted AAA+ superfamily ATPase